MASRTWLAVVLACLVWFGYIKYFAPPPPPPAGAIQTGQAGQPSSQQTVSGTDSPSQPGVAVAPGYFDKAIPQVASHQITTDKLEIGLSDVGGKIAEVRLLGFRESVSKTAPPITLIGSQVSTFSLATLFTDANLAPLTAAPYKGQVDGMVARFSHAAANGAKISKEFRFSNDSYLVDATYKIVLPNDAARRDWGYLLLPVGAQNVKFDAHDPLHSFEVVAMQSDSVTRKTIEGLEAGEKIFQGNTSWMAFGNRYFSSALLNASAINPDIVFYKDSHFSGGFLRYPLVVKEGQKELNFIVRYYLGPKEVEQLSKVPGLKQLIDYGMFKALAYPLLEILKFFYKFVHNYGIAIILLTLLVRLIFYPLSLKSFKSMKAMQRLQPQLAALKEKYGEDREKFSKEQMALFKAHKVNPAGGCLPIFIQMPIFIALYAVLGNSIELFHAPFFGWIQDLCTKDPFYIFPVLMGMAMLVQQKLTPSVGMDPVQQKMMYLMPIVFTFMMVSLPSGLTVYMFVSTLVGILQQYSMMRDPNMKTPAMVAVKAPEKS